MDMAATISGALVQRKRQRLPLAPCENIEGVSLKRVADTEGNTTKLLTKKQKNDHGQSVGSSKQQTCFVCKKYKKKCSWSSASCPRCQTCLCLRKRRELSCLEEHLNSDDPNIRCNGVKKITFPAVSRADTCEE